MGPIESRTVLPAGADPAGTLPGVRLVLHRGGWLLLGLLLGLLAGYGAHVVRPPEYASTAIVTVSADAATDELSLARGAQALARLATSPGVVAAPLQKAGLPDVAKSPHTFVTVEAAPDAPIISVTGTATSPATAQLIARTVSVALTTLQPFAPFRATVVAAPALPATATAPSWLLPAGGAGIGAALALVLAATVPGKRERRLPA